MIQVGLLYDQGRNHVLKVGGTNPWRARKREPVMGVWGQSPQWGPGAKPGRGVRDGFAPLKLTTFLHLKVNMNNKNCIIFCIIYAINNATISAGNLLKDREAHILQPKVEAQLESLRSDQNGDYNFMTSRSIY